MKPLRNGVNKVQNNAGHTVLHITGGEWGGDITFWSIPQAGAEPEPNLEIFTDENSSGFIAVCDATGDYRATLGVATPQHGGAGRIAIHGTVDNRERIVIGCNPETDNGNIKTYSGAWQETDSLGDEKCDLRVFNPPRGESSDIHRYQHTLKRIEEKLQQETNRDQKRFLNIKKKALSDIIEVLEADEIIQ